MVSPRDAARQVGVPSRRGGQAHGPSHAHGLARARHCRVEEHSVTAQLEDHGHVGGRAHTGVHDHGDPRTLLDEEQVVRVADTEAGADGGGQRHDGGAAQVLQLARRHRIVVRIGKHLEPCGHQGARGVEQPPRRGTKCPRRRSPELVDEIGLERLPRQLGREHRILGRVAARRVGRICSPRARRASSGCPPPLQTDTPHRHRDHLLPEALRAASSVCRLGSGPCPAAVASAACVRPASRCPPRVVCSHG